MYKIVRFYNQNRKAIWKVILCIVLIVLIIQGLNYIAKRKMKENSIQNQVAEEKSSNLYNSLVLENNESVLSGEDLSERQKTEIEYIDKFFEYCNNNNIEKAYDMLTDECKEQMYPQIENFKQGYYSEIFEGESKNIIVDNWKDNIYKIIISEDILATGGKNRENNIRDYITVKRDDDDVYKLNINSYIGRKERNNQDEKENIKIKISAIDTYMDYEIYTFEIKNGLDNRIMVDNLESLDSLYIEDSKKVKYSAYTHELIKNQLVINPREIRNIKIKYYNKYGSTKNIKKVVFSHIILNYDNYSNIQNKNYYSNYLNFEISV